MALAARLAFKLQGHDRDEGRVRAHDFASFLDSVLACLRQVEKLTGAKDQIVYRITDLQQSSAVIAFEAVPVTEAPDLTQSVISLFARGAQSLERGTSPPEVFDRPTLERFRALAAPLHRHVTSIAVETPYGNFDISRRIQEAVDKLLGQDVASFDTVSGYLDAVNVHVDAIFFLYPPTGTRGIRCYFSPSNLAEVKEAITRYVTVTGAFLYHAKETFPVRIDVHELAINPSAEALPRLRSFLGVRPNLTGGLESASYVRSLRDAEA